MFSQLQSEWIVGWKNIVKQDYVGESHGYTCEQTSVGTTNGAGPHNVQLFLLSPDGVVLHCLPGFWHPEDLGRALKFGQRLLALWQDPVLSPAEKRARFPQLQLAELASQPRETYARSAWQGFDAKNELKRLAQGPRDTFRVDAAGQLVEGKKGQPQLKRTNEVVYERMAKRPFVPFALFDTATFADYGRRYYDNNKKVDGAGATFMTPRRVAKQERKLAKRRQRAARQARRLSKQRDRLERGAPPAFLDE